MRRTPRTLIAVTAAAAALLATAVVAYGHQATATVDCTAGHINYTSSPGTTLTYDLLVGNAVVAHAVAGPFTAANATGTINVPYTAPAGPFVAQLNAQFSTKETATSGPVSLTCSTPPTPAPPAAPAPPVAPVPPQQATVPAQAPPAPRPARHRAKTRCKHGRHVYVIRRGKHKGEKAITCRHLRKPKTTQPAFTG